MDNTQGAAAYGREVRVAVVGLTVDELSHRAQDIKSLLTMHVKWPMLRLRLACFFF